MLDDRLVSLPTRRSSNRPNASCTRNACTIARWCRYEMLAESLRPYIETTMKSHRIVQSGYPMVILANALCERRKHADPYDPRLGQSARGADAL